MEKIIFNIRLKMLMGQNLYHLYFKSVALSFFEAFFGKKFYANFCVMTSSRKFFLKIIKKERKKKVN